MMKVDALTRARLLVQALIEGTFEAADGHPRDPDWERMVANFFVLTQGEEHAALMRLGTDQLIGEIHKMILASRDGAEMRRN
jgi:hypothetical protein